MSPTTLENLPRISIPANDDEYTAARSKNWVALSDRGFEILTHDHSSKIIKSNQFDIGGGFGLILDMVGLTEGTYREEWDKQLVCTDGERRDYLRKPYARLLNLKIINSLRELVCELINKVLDDIEDLSDVDFMAQIGNRIPTLLYCKLVSIPLDEEEKVFRITEAINPPILNLDRSRIKESEEAYWEGKRFLGKHIEARRGSLGDDFTSEIIRCQQDGLINEEDVASVAMSLLMASMDNTMHQIGLTFGTLLEDRSRWEMVLANPDKHSQAAEETFRLCPRFNVIARHASKEITVDNFTFPANSRLWMAIRSVSHDERTYKDSTKFSLERPDSRSLQFGGSRYSCLGANLARLEVTETIRIISERYPNIRMLGNWRKEVGPMTTECEQLRVSLV